MSDDYLIEGIKEEIYLSRLAGDQFSPGTYLSASPQEIQSQRRAAKEALNNVINGAANSNNAATFQLTAFKILKFLVVTRQISILTADVGSQVDRARVFKVIGSVYGWRVTWLAWVFLIFIIGWLLWGLLISQHAWWQVILGAMGFFFAKAPLVQRWVTRFVRRRCLDSYSLTELCWESRFIAFFDEIEKQTYSYHHSKVSFASALLVILDKDKKRESGVLSMEEGRKN